MQRATVQPPLPAPQLPPAPQQALVALAEHGIRPRWTLPPPGQADKRLRQVLRRLGPPRPILALNAEGTVEALADAMRYVDDLIALPAETQRALLGWMSSLARHIQDEVDTVLGSSAEERLRAVFSILTRWSREQRPGFVPGLSRRNGPDHASWFEDAVTWWETLSDWYQPDGPTDAPTDPIRALEELLQGQPTSEAIANGLRVALDAGVHQTDARLVRLLAPHAEIVAALPGLKTLKAVLRTSSKPSTLEEPSDDGSVTLVPDDWPHLEVTSGKRAVILGGDRRPQAMERIRTAFRFGLVEWELTDARRVGALAERVRSGSVDLVILLRAFIGHSDQGVVLEACRASGVPFAVVDSGYGVSQVKLAIERYISLDAA